MRRRSWKGSQIGYLFCGEAGHFARDFQNLMHPSCQYCWQFDHVIEDCLVLIANMQEKEAQTAKQNIQMMRAEPRKEENSINIMTQSDIATGENKGKQLEAKQWVRKVGEKEVWFDLSHTKETFMEAKNSFAEASTLGTHENYGRNNSAQDVYPSLLAEFLMTCMKILRDRRATIFD